ncbi:MAG: hypothetical protein OSA99_16580, partial [Acidimicrobiales bacterium]|nr:hypothetical protein [Acidimicrobiales bacterium]
MHAHTPIGRVGVHVARTVSAVVLSVLVGLVAATAPAGADSVPVDPALPATVTADALPTVQIDGVVWDQVVVGDTVYVTGDFSTARPAGSAPGQDETPRENILAFDITTGELVTSWAPSLNNQGLAIEASDDGTTIFVGGDFSQVSGEFRNRLAAIDAVTGAVVDGFNPVVNTRVASMDAVGDTLYFGGYFTTVDGLSRSRLAAVDAATGDLLPWAPTVDREVVSMIVHEPSNRVIVGGSFYDLNGASNPGMASIDGDTGATRPWAINQLIQQSGDATEIADLTVSGDLVYGGAWDFGGGDFEGQFAADALTGDLVWVNGCRGDTYGVHVMNEALYSVGHAHDC